MRILERKTASVRVRDRGTGPAIVFTPDCPSVIEHYVPLLHQIEASGRRTVCFDLPGFGFSRPQNGYDYSLACGAELVIDLLDALEIERATLAFSCANGFYALAAAKRAPERIERLVLSQTPSIAGMRAWADRMVPRALRVPHLGQAIIRVLRRPAARYWYRIAVADGRSPDDLSKIADDALARGGAYRLADMVQGLAPARDAQIEGVVAPVTLVWGERDRSHRGTPADSLRHHVPGANVVRFEDAGHFPDLEAPERYAKLLLSEESAR